VWQSVRLEYTLSVQGFRGELGAKVVDDSRGFLKAPFAIYAGVRGVRARAPVRRRCCMYSA
jgi:hypothetical protein